jgi:periplasmic mercuric ion binding protein
MKIGSPSINHPYAANSIDFIPQKSVLRYSHIVTNYLHSLLVIFVKQQYKMKYTFLFLFAVLFSLQATAQTTPSRASKATKSTLTSAEFRVWGNCDMCKATIEGVAKASGAKEGTWSKETDKLTIKFDPQRITLEHIQRNIAALGYDNDRFYGSDEAYAKLPECCQYERKTKIKN